jgi:ketosteroid isomerase-like protein
MNEDREFIETLKAEREIAKVIMRYARGSDRKDFDLMRSAYHEDAIDNHGPFNGPVKTYFEWADQHHERYDMLMHIMGNPHIEVEKDVAFAETYCLLLQRMKAEKTYNSEVALHITIACRYVDRFEKRDGAWKIAVRNVVYEWVKKEWASEEVAREGLAGSTLAFGKRSRDDMVYRVRDEQRP